MDLVGTCPMTFWEEWIAEGDPAGTDWSGEEWGWYTGHNLRFKARPGDRFYVVAHGQLRGYAPILRVHSTCIVRGGNAVACKISEPIPGFRGLRQRWWARVDEMEFRDWKSEGISEPTPNRRHVATRVSKQPSLF